MTNSGGQPLLKRALGPAALIFYGVGDILGAGIYALVGKVAGVVGPAVWLSFIAAFVAAALTALSYAELSSRYPRSAGAAVYTLEAFRSPWLSYVIGLMVLFSGIVSMAAASHAFAGYFSQLLPALTGNAVILFFFIALAAINLKGIKESSAANVICTLIEVAGLLIVITAGMRFFGKADIVSIRPAEGFTPAVAVLQGGVLAFYAFLGFEDLVNVAEEAKDSEKLLPRAILLSLGIGTVIYILVALAAVSAVAPAELAASKAPLVSVVQRGFPGFPVWLFSLIALFAVANTALLNYVMGSRLLYGMSVSGLIPAVFKNVHPKTGTPYWAIAVMFVVVLVLAFSGSLVVLAQSTSLLLLCVFFIVNLALVVLKLKAPSPGKIFRVPLAIPLLGMAAACGLMIFVNAQAFTIVGILTAFIAGSYFLTGGRSRRPNVR